MDTNQNQDFDKMKPLEVLGFLLRKLNNNDIKIMVYCDHSTRSVGELTELIGIAQNNLIKRLKYLELNGRLEIKRGEKGKKTFVSIPTNIDPVFINSCHLLFLAVIGSELYETGKRRNLVDLTDSDAKIWLDYLKKSHSKQARPLFKKLTEEYMKK